MDLDFGEDLQEEEQYDGEGATQRSEGNDDLDQTQLDDDDESNADSNDGDEESAANTRSMRSSRSPEALEDDGDVMDTSGDKPKLQAHADECSYYDVIPYVAAPQATHVNCVVTTRNLRWFFTGGQDGYIRKHDFHQTITGKVPLTVAQKHAFVDTVQRSGVLVSYWENDENDDESNTMPVSEKLSPIYCLAVQSDAIWMLCGQQSGKIKLQSVRVEEGKTVATLQAHTAPVSVLQLTRDEKSLLSGGWDKQIFDWDLEIGRPRRNYIAGNEITGQVSNIVMRPDGASDIDLFEKQLPVVEKTVTQPSVLKTGSPGSEISFDPLFDDEDDNQTMSKEAPVEQDVKTNGHASGSPDVFLSACIDGTMSIWDRRQTSACARLNVPKGVPPWCMSACWSFDGESIFCGRRNGTVEEYQVRGDLSLPSRSIKLPNNSGPVSCVATMPNKRSLICASQDNIRMYDLQHDGTGMPFLIIPGHHGGVVSQFYVDPTCRYAFSTSGNRGWDGTSTEVLLGYEIVVPRDALPV